MHQTNDKSCIRENTKVTQYDQDSENVNDEEHIEAPRRLSLDINAVKKSCISQSENLFKGHTRSWPRSSFAPFDSNCTKQ